ncbi:hypothetical protein D9758_004413 [Tetrapyrgos nigripes]|uniref:CN hydrolase domain-containing protein n=1 Tax=Tetrapyrgos nigripes TaxID=182062 RepID=A0A8H5LSS7_9AGAR|nr:hypothetical protein D9758_004413 [Tetrapyrgos nigripes]
MSITKVAAIQAEPVWFDLQGGVIKVISLIQEAASNGAHLIGFPESFIPGYPMAIWTQGFDPTFLVQFQKNCLDVKSDEYNRIRKVIKDIGTIWVVLGFTERDGQSMYCAQSVINPQGQVILHRRKLKATGQERTIWGDAPADSLKTAIASAPGGPIIGSLNCWEHLQPLLKYHHFTLGTQIHVASWPFCGSIAEGAPPQFSSDFQDTLSRAIAIEGQMFVLQSTQLIKNENFDKCRIEGTPWAPKHGGGFAAIYGPTGIRLAEAASPSEEAIIYANINLDEIMAAKLAGDTVGHYSRPDLLSLVVCPSSTLDSPATVKKAGGKTAPEYGDTLLAKISPLED